MSYKWIPVVYAATYSVDFRLLTAPTELSRGSGKTWLTSLILPTLQAPQHLENAPLWTIFQTDTWRVFGVAALARSIINENSCLTTDRFGRSQHLFLGYAAQKSGSGEFPSAPSCEANASLFSPLYAHIEEHWHEKRFVGPVESKSIAMDTPVLVRLARAFDRGVSLNYDSHHISLWPDSPKSRRELWKAAIADSRPVSVLLGSASKRQILQSPFVNGTLAQIDTTTILSR